MFRIQITQEEQNAFCSVEGSLSFDSALRFKNWCESQGDAVSNLPIHLDKLDFVGSTGIMSFIEGLKVIEKKSQSPVLIRGAKPEFKILCQGLGLGGLQFE
jgi:anti-anti-sigma regulatory factor